MTEGQPDRQLSAAHALIRGVRGRARAIGALAGVALLAAALAGPPAGAESADAGNWIGT